jgi:hypothetical protein
MKRTAFATALILLAAGAFAQQEPSSADAPENDPTIVEVRDKLRSDPALADAVASRVSRSRLAGQMTSGEVRAWVAKDPTAAARVALGLAQDDQRGTSAYEDALLKQFHTAYGANPGAEKNIFGRLRKTAGDSKLLKKQSEDLSEDERREILRTLFEGKGAQGDKVLSARDSGRGPSPKISAGPATSFNGYYDRLSALNLHGYSPQLLALQNELNARRPPGAPALVETGKLDYATLSFPSFGMNFDVVNLEARLARERASFSGAAAEASLLRRAERVAKARKAADAFARATARAKNPALISRELLLELSRRQQEAARWITAAALEEELGREEALKGFLTPELLAAIAAAPAPADAKEAYKRRGFALQNDVERTQSDARRAQELLEADSWESKSSEIDRLMRSNPNAKRTLARDVAEYSSVPYRFDDASAAKPRWRKALEDLAIKWAPSTAFAQEAAARRARKRGALEAFLAIAAAGRGSAP